MKHEGKGKIINVTKLKENNAYKFWKLKFPQI